MWSPWYTLHKTFAGLRDAYRFTGNRTALELEIRFARWADGIVGQMNDAQVQRMLNTEFGGMNEVFADLYADTGDPRWLVLSYKFEHRAFTEPLKRHQDNLAGKHVNTQEWDHSATELAAQRERQRTLEATTVGFAQPGEMQAERDANMQGEDTEPILLQGRPGPRGAKWFSFDLPVDSAHPMALVVTYNHDEWQERRFDVLVDGVRVGEQTIERRGPVRFFDVEYAVPAETVRGKQKVTVKFQAASGSEIGAVFGIRMIRFDSRGRIVPGSPSLNPIKP
jgi:hypothetical protein